LVLGAVGFYLAERRPGSLFHYDLFRNRRYWLGALGVFVMNLTFSVMILLLPFYLEDYLLLREDQAGLMLGICPLLTLLAAPLAGQLADRSGALWPAVAGFAACASGFALLAQPGIQGNNLWLGIGLGLLGIAGGLFNSPVIAAMMGSVTEEQRPYASSFNSLARNLGFMSGTTFGALWLGLFLAAYGGQTLRAAAHSEQLSQAVPLVAFRYAAGATFWVCTAACALLALMMLRYPNRMPQPEASAG
jgi:MFS family permease